MSSQTNIVPKSISRHEPPSDATRIIEVLRAAAAPLTGDEFLHNLVEQLGRLLQAETTFVARRTDPSSTMVRGLAAWKDGKRKETWEYDLTGNPCHLVYDGEPVVIPCDIAGQFENKRDSGYASFVGIPLKGLDAEVIGHIGVYSSKELVEDDAWVEICGLFADRAQAEILRAQMEDERLRTIEKLNQLDQQKNEFISVAAHDMRGPLGVIRALADMMGRMPLDDEKRTSIYKTITTASNRMLELVDQYLDVTAMAGGQVTLEKAPLALGPFIKERVAFRQILADDKGVTIETDINGSVTIGADADRLGQALDNIIDNALKYSPENGVVSVSVRSVSEMIEITVADQGPGIPADERDRIFDPFTTAGDGEGKVGKSFGLGLMIASRIVKAHDGEITVDEASGGGAVFAIRLPA